MTRTATSRATNRRRGAIVALALCVVCNAVSAQATWQDYSGWQKLKREGSAKNGLAANTGDIYLSGVANGLIAAMNTAGAKQPDGSTRMSNLCVPNGQGFSGAMIDSAIGVMVAKHGPPPAELDLGLVAIFALTDQFPCAKP